MIRISSGGRRNGNNQVLVFVLVAALAAGFLSVRIRILFRIGIIIPIAAVIIIDRQAFREVCRSKASRLIVMFTLQCVCKAACRIVGIVAVGGAINMRRAAATRAVAVVCVM